MDRCWSYRNSPPSPSCSSGCHLRGRGVRGRIRSPGSRPSSPLHRPAGRGRAESGRPAPHVPPAYRLSVPRPPSWLSSGRGCRKRYRPFAAQSAPVCGTMEPESPRSPHSLPFEADGCRSALLPFLLPMSCMWQLLPAAMPADKAIVCLFVFSSFSVFFSTSYEHFGRIVLPNAP